jgi:cytochrome P450
MVAMTPPVDIVDAFALPLSMDLISDVIGIPTHKRTEFRKRSDIVLNTACDDYQVAVGALDELNVFVSHLVSEGRNSSSSGLIAHLLECTDSGNMTESELVTMILGLPIAGYVSTSNAIGIAIEEFLPRADLAELRDPKTRRGAVEETLRFQSGVNGESMPRMALEDVTIGSTLIRAGEVVIAPLASGNRDPQIFTDPERFDITRASNPHIAFGRGIHKCLGKALARLELDVALEALATHASHVQLAGVMQDRGYRTNLFGDIVASSVLVTWP